MTLKNAIVEINAQMEKVASEGLYEGKSPCPTRLKSFYLGQAKGAMLLWEDVEYLLSKVDSLE